MLSTAFLGNLRRMVLLLRVVLVMVIVGIENLWVVVMSLEASEPMDSVAIRR